ncbi:MAG: methyl-accepting chemotaxis protein [Desulfovibrio sp.]
MSFMENVNSSLRLKVLLLSSLVSLAVFASLFLATSYWQKKAILGEVQASAERSAKMLAKVVEEPMRLGDTEATLLRFEELAKEHKNISVLMTDYAGNVTYSTVKEDERKDASEALGHAESFAMVQKSLQAPLESSAVMTVKGTEYFTEVKTIPNEPACYHCHGKSKPILGVMVMRQDLTEQMGALHMTQYLTAILCLAGLAALVLTLNFFMDRAVLGRVKSIAKSADDVISGDLNAQFSVTGNDELANLSSHLGAMVSRIKDQLEYNKGLLEGIIVPMMVTDELGAITVANKPLVAILGKSEKEIMGKCVDTVFYGEKRSDTITQRAISTCSSVSGNLVYTRGDGVRFPLHAEISPLKNTQGQVVGSIGVLIDLTQEEQDRMRIEANRQNLLAVANEVTTVAKRLEEASGDLTSQMQHLTTGMDTTSDRTTQMATAMEEMNATVLEVAKNASDTADASNKARNVAREGGEMVQSTLKEIREVSGTAHSLSTALSELSSSAQNIGQVMSVINDIADQTNLLALNAAIEAARAGDAGRGFAVVADEVRKLAEKTMTATKEVDSAIQLIQHSTQDAVNQMQATKERVDKSSELAGGAGGMLTEIVDASEHMADMVRSIATAAEQQSATSDEINTNVSEINSLATQMADDVQKANNDIASLAETARNLAQLVEKFRSE